MGHELALELDVDPEQALLLTVRRRAARVAWVDGIIALMVSEHLASDGGTLTNLPKYVHTWMAESRKEETLMARAAKAAIDAEVSARVVRQFELEGRLVAEALSAGLDALELTVDQRITALQAGHSRLLQLESKVEPPENGPFQGGLPPMDDQ